MGDGSSEPREHTVWSTHVLERHLSPFFEWLFCTNFTLIRPFNIPGERVSRTKSRQPLSQYHFSLIQIISALRRHIIDYRPCIEMVKQYHLSRPKKILRNVCCCFATSTVAAVSPRIEFCLVYPFSKACTDTKATRTALTTYTRRARLCALQSIIWLYLRRWNGQKQVRDRREAHHPLGLVNTPPFFHQKRCAQPF